MDYKVRVETMLATQNGLTRSLHPIEHSTYMALFFPRKIVTFVNEQINFHHARWSGHYPSLRG